MRAAVVEAPGSSPVLRERPGPGPGEVRVRVVAAPITPLDRLCATGTSCFGAPAVPYVPGVQGVGTAADGRPVWSATSAGTAAGDGSVRAAVAVPERDVVELPGDADPVLVAALGLSAVAAWCALTATGRLAAGETVLVLGAATARSPGRASEEREPGPTPDGGTSDVPWLEARNDFVLQPAR